MAMRIQGKLRLGSFPLPFTEARRIRACLRYPTSPLSAIDPCIGDGAAFLPLRAIPVLPAERPVEAPLARRTPGKFT
jgi:hypothetical protein